MKAMVSDNTESSKRQLNPVRLGNEIKTDPQGSGYSGLWPSVLRTLNNHTATFSRNLFIRFRMPVAQFLFPKEKAVLAIFCGDCLTTMSNSGLIRY